MAFLAAGAVILGWLSVSLAAPLACEDLIQPLDQLHLPDVMGRWTFVAGSLSGLPISTLKEIDSLSVNVSNENGLSYTQTMCRRNKSRYLRRNVTLEGISFSYEGTDKRNISASFLRTSCRDCLLVRVDLNLGEFVQMYLFSRRRQLELEELEEFEDQMQCLNMPPPVAMDHEKPLCQEETGEKTGA